MVLPPLRLQVAADGRARSPRAPCPHGGARRRRRPPRRRVEARADDWRGRHRRHTTVVHAAPRAPVRSGRHLQPDRARGVGAAYCGAEGAHRDARAVPQRAPHLPGSRVGGARAAVAATSSCFGFTDPECSSTTTRSRTWAAIPVTPSRRRSSVWRCSGALDLAGGLYGLTSYHSFLQVRTEYQGLSDQHISDAFAGSTIRAPELIRHQAETSVDRVPEDAVSIVQATMDRVWQAAGHRRSEVHASEVG